MRLNVNMCLYKTESYRKKHCELITQNDKKEIRTVGRMCGWSWLNYGHDLNKLVEDYPQTIKRDIKPYTIVVSDKNCIMCFS